MRLPGRQRDPNSYREILRGLKAEDRQYRNADKAVRSAERVLSREARRSGGFGRRGRSR